MIYQKTLKNDIYANGIGLHSGEETSLKVRSAPPNAGIVFVSKTNGTPVEIKAGPGGVIATSYSTTLGNASARVATVEHLMATFSGLGVDNAIVEVNAAELPIMDGSAAPWVFLIQSAGLAAQDKLKRFIRILAPLEVKDPKTDAWVRLTPSDEFTLEFELVYDHPVFQGTSDPYSSFDFSTSAFVKEISRARTYGFLDQHEQLLAMNLARGCSLKNVVVLDDTDIVNEERLRYRDEFARHKILDAIGDLYMLGHNVLGAYSGYKAGHTLNHALVCKLLDSPDAWEYVTFDGSNSIPSSYLEQASVEWN